MSDSRLPELWGGVECTVNRVHDRYFDQLERNQHARRADDLEALPGLGLRRIRYPVLWERTAPEQLDRCDWRWSDERLWRLRDLGIEPIVGLLHHGSGPSYTSLIDPAFPEKLAAYARRVAEQYPWVQLWTPVNEPLTTARFSGLYGFWYPHGTDRKTFLRALLNQCRGTVLAMQAIRDVIPAAGLVQTEDMGHTYATPTLAYQARYENERRWLSLDLLTGRLAPGHRLWGDALLAGFEHEVEWLAEHAIPPTVIGLNYYPTSDRYLDERLDEFPEWSHGGNSRERYADVEAVRVRGLEMDGFGAVLRRAWQRYGLPVAITECHINASPEEQFAWFLEAWHAAQDVRAAGADVRAVTLWALFGSFDWHCLVQREEGHYEPGPFDCRGETLVPTRLHELLSAFLARQPAAHGAAVDGWWRTSARFLWDARPALEGAA